MKTFIQNIECLRIELAAGQTTYYFPTLEKARAVSRIFAYLPTSNTFDITGKRVVMLGEVTNAYMTVARVGGGSVIKDLPLNCLSLSQFDHPNSIDDVIDFENSYIRFANSSSLDNRVLLLYLVYDTQRDVANRQYKVMTVNFDSTAMQQRRMSDYIVGYQGELVKIELQSNHDVGAFLSLSDANGLSVEFIPCDMFRTGQDARIFNPYYFSQLIPNWQNSYIYSRERFTLNLYFKQ